MSDITIPPEAVEAAARAAWGYEGTSVWERAMARKIIAAAINAWPGMKEQKVQVPDDKSDDIRYMLKLVGIILPLPQEARDD